MSGRETEWSLGLGKIRGEEKERGRSDLEEFWNSLILDFQKLNSGEGKKNKRVKNSFRLKDKFFSAAIWILP